MAGIAEIVAMSVNIQVIFVVFTGIANGLYFINRKFCVRAPMFFDRKIEGAKAVLLKKRLMGRRRNFGGYQAIKFEKILKNAIRKP
jgi:hypothetical protein